MSHFWVVSKEVTDYDGGWTPPESGRMVVMVEAENPAKAKARAIKHWRASKGRDSWHLTEFGSPFALIQYVQPASLADEPEDDRPWRDCIDCGDSP